MTVCDRCGDKILMGDWPFCPHGRTIAGRGADVTWPGGKTFENLGDKEMTFYSPAELKKYLRQTNQEEYVRHQPVPGSDTSPHTVDWSKGSIDAQTLANAAALLDRSGRGKDSEPRTWVQEWVPSTEVGVTTVLGRL